MNLNRVRSQAQSVSSRRNNKPTVYFFIVLFLATQGIYSCKSDHKTADQATILKTDVNSAVRDSFQTQIAAARMQVDDLSGKTVVLDSQVRLKDAEIARLEKERNQLSTKNKKLAGKLKKGDKMIASLRHDLDEKDRMYAEKLGLLQSDKDNLTQQLADLTKKYTDLKTLGSVLHASDISLEPLHVKKRSRREKLTHRARKLNILRIHFDIDENRIAEDGTKQLYLVIDGPDGKLLSNEAHRPGELTTYKGNKINYSIKKDIFLKQNEPVKDVTVDWNQEGEHEKGDYNIAIYNGGYKIGAGSVALK